MTIQDRVYSDFLAFKEQEIAKGAEAVFANAYDITLATEWNHFFQEWFQEDFIPYVPKGKQQQVVDILFELPNIIETLLKYIIETIDCVEISADAYSSCLSGYLRHEHDFQA